MAAEKYSDNSLKFQCPPNIQVKFSNKYLDYYYLTLLNLFDKRLQCLFLL